MRQTLYGQYCPIAMTLELLGGRWTILIIRELLGDVTRFNDIHRGVPLMSRSLLSERLKTLEKARLVAKMHSARSGHAEYQLTEGGRALGQVVLSIGAWGQEWLDTALALDTIDGGYLMWSIRGSARWTEAMGPRGVAHFHFADWDGDHKDHWLVLEPEDKDLCYVDPGFEVDVWIRTDLRTMCEVWMGWAPLCEKRDAGLISIDGDPTLTADPLVWIGQSPLAGISKRPPVDRVGQLMANLRT